MGNPFADLIPAQASGNPFADLVPNFNDRFKGEDVKKAQPSLSDAVTDIPKEIGNAASENWAAIKKAVTDRASKGSIEGLMDTGKGLAGVAGLIASPITGTARSLIGHPMALAEHAVGTKIAPEIAAKDDPQKMYETAKGDVDTAMAAARPSRAPVKIPAASIPELKASATAVYNSPAIKSINIPPADAAALASKIENDLTQQGFRPSVGNAPLTMEEVKNLTPGPGVQSVSVDDLRSARRALNKAAGLRDPMTGAATTDANAATQAIGHIDTFLDTLAPELKTANADYAAASGAERLDYRMAKAEHRAGRTGIGGNLENVMRQEADKIPNRGLTSDEQSIRDQIVMGSPVRNALRTTGKLGVDGGLSLMLHTGAALGTGGTTIPVTVAGTIARKLGEFLTRGQMAKLSEQIRSRAPLSSSLQKLHQSATGFYVTPGAKTYGGLLMASRNFSNNLKGTGINIAPGDLMKMLQSPGNANADEQQVPGQPAQQ